MVEYRLGNADAFAALYGRHKDKVYGYLTKKLSSKSETNDVFQETFLRLHRFRAKYDPSFPFLPWLFTICRNTLVDHFRRRARIEEDSTESVDSFEAPSPSSPESPLTATDSLSNRESEILRLHYVHGYSFGEVARYLKIQPAGARKISSRAIQKIKEFLKR